MVNTVRGEAELVLGDKTFVLRPEHERAVELDEVLPAGILGTLLTLTGDRVIKTHTLAIVIGTLSDPPRLTPAELMPLIVQGNITSTSAIVIGLLRQISSGGLETPPGEPDAPSSEETGSTGADD
jgi:hypothetical protein